MPCPPEQKRQRKAAKAAAAVQQAGGAGDDDDDAFDFDNANAADGLGSGDGSGSEEVREGNGRLEVDWWGWMVGWLIPTAMTQQRFSGQNEVLSREASGGASSTGGALLAGQQLCFKQCVAWATEQDVVLTQCLDLSMHQAHSICSVCDES